MAVLIERRQNVNGHQKTFQDDGTVLYFELSGDFMIMHSYQNFSSSVFDIDEIDLNNTLINKKEKKPL